MNTATPSAVSIPQFCELHSISRALFYVLQKMVARRARCRLVEFSFPLKQPPNGDGEWKRRAKPISPQFRGDHANTNKSRQAGNRGGFQNTLRRQFYHCCVHASR